MDTHMRMNQVVKIIRKNGSVDLVLNDEVITVGFYRTGTPAMLVMLDGGYYIVTTVDGRKFDIAKGEMVVVRTADMPTV